MGGLTIGRLQGICSRQRKVIRFLQEHYNKVVFLNMRLQSGQPIQLPLKDVFISTRLKPGFPEFDLSQGISNDASSSQSIIEFSSITVRQPEDLIDALAAIGASRLTVILGEPGTGKTTILNFITSSLASGDIDRIPLLLGCLPILVSLRAYSAELLKNSAMNLVEYASASYSVATSSSIATVI